MTPKEKAEELIGRFLPIVDYGQTEAENHAKQCALIAVDEILKTDPQTVEYIGDRIDPLLYTKECKGNTGFWQEVRNELEKI